MKALFVTAAVLASTTANAGWFGLTEDYPFKAEGPDRTAYIYTGTAACIKATPANNIFRLTTAQIQSVCQCKAERMADIITKTEIDYIIKNNHQRPSSITKKDAEADMACVREAIPVPSDLVPLVQR